MEVRVLILLIGLVLVSCEKEEISQTAQYKNMTISVYAAATVNPDNFKGVYSEIPGILEKVFIKEGDIVKKGNRIGYINSNMFKSNAEQAKIANQYAKESYLGDRSMLVSLKNDIVSVKKQLQLDSTNYERQKYLWNNGVGAKVEMESIELKYELSKIQLSNTIKRYELLESELETNFKASQNSLSQATNKLKDENIYARSSGKIYKLLKEEGEFINQQEMFAMIGDESKFIIEMEIDEIDITKIKINQKLVIRIDAYGNKIYDAYISKIYPTKDDRSQTFKVEALFSNEPKQLYAGLSGEANIIINEHEKVLTIPNEYLVDKNKVLTKKGLKVIQVGDRDLESIIVTSGLDTSTVIIMPTL